MENMQAAEGRLLHECAELPGENIRGSPRYKRPDEAGTHRKSGLAALVGIFFLSASAAAVGRGRGGCQASANRAQICREISAPTNRHTFREMLLQEVGCVL